MIMSFEDGRHAVMETIGGCHGHCLADERPDHRLGTYRDPAGELMCRAQAGVIFSEMRVTMNICGSDRGCEGTWRCLKASHKNIPVSGM